MNTIDCPKCHHTHEPIGSHEDDSGEHECEECGFNFTVEIEYDPDYITSCVECDHSTSPIMEGGGVKFQLCRYCESIKILKGEANNGKSKSVLE